MTANKIYAADLFMKELYAGNLWEYLIISGVGCLVMYCTQKGWFDQDFSDLPNSEQKVDTICNKGDQSIFVDLSSELSNTFVHKITKKPYLDANQGRGGKCPFGYTSDGHKLQP